MVLDPARIGQLSGAREDLAAIAAEIGGRAAKQHGVISWRELRELGLSPRMIGARVDNGALVEVFERVYGIGHRPTTWRAHAMAAVLACGPGAALMGRSAATLWDLLPLLEKFEVATCDGNARRGIETHRRRNPATTTHHGIPVTTIPQTLADLAANQPLPLLTRAVQEAQVRKRLPPAATAIALQLSRGKPGARELKALLEDHPGGRSHLERAFLKLAAQAGLPEPARNAYLEIAGHIYEVDVLYRDLNLVIELDGFEAHGTRQAFEDDRDRDAAFLTAGFVVLRVTWRAIHQRRNELRGRLEAIAAARRGAAGP